MKKKKTCKTPSSACHDIKLNKLMARAMPEGNYRSFWKESIKLTFFLTVYTYRDI
jgi:hypothetical protein